LDLRRQFGIQPPERPKGNRFAFIHGGGSL
jgi:hypothetical protein